MDSTCSLYEILSRKPKQSSAIPGCELADLVAHLPSHASETRSALIAEAFANSGIVRGDQDVILFTGIPHPGPPRIANSIPLRD